MYTFHGYKYPNLCLIHTTNKHYVFTYTAYMYAYSHYTYCMQAFIKYVCTQIHSCTYKVMSNRANPHSDTYY